MFPFTRSTERLVVDRTGLLNRFEQRRIRLGIMERRSRPIEHGNAAYGSKKRTGPSINSSAARSIRRSCGFSSHVVRMSVTLGL